MGENSGQIGTKDISKRYPVPSNTGIEADSYHEGRKIFLEPQEACLVPKALRESI